MGEERKRPVSKKSKCVYCGTSYDDGPTHIKECKVHKCSDSELMAMHLVPEECVHRNPTDDTLSKQYDIISRFPCKMFVNSNQSEIKRSEFVYHKNGIVMASYTETDGAKKSTVTPILNCPFSFISKVEYRAVDTSDDKWAVMINGNKETGTIDEIIKKLVGKGFVVTRQDELRIALSHIVSTTTIPVQEVYPCAGVFLVNDKKLNYVNNNDSVFATLDSQKKYLKSMERAYCLLDDKITREQRKQVLEASVKLINSMPKANTIPALVARAYSITAPIGYILKTSITNIYPYLYLYGKANSSKTHLARFSTRFIYGVEKEINSQDTDTSFRMAQVFSATTFPQLIDEAQATFVKHISMFKAAATSGNATSRGNKNMEVTEYPAFSNFIFTSNEESIAPEEDAENAMASRIISIKCDQGQDFNLDLYLEASEILMHDGMILGDTFINYLTTKVETQGFRDGISKPILEMAKNIRTLNPGMETRRSYALASVLIGLEYYKEMLLDYGIALPNAYTDPSLIQNIVSTIQGKFYESQKQFIYSFVDWVSSVMTGDIKYTKPAEKGLYLGMNGAYIVTPRAISTYAKTYNSPMAAKKTLESLKNDLDKLGIMCSISSQKTVGDEYNWGLKFDIKEYMQKFQPHTSQP